MPFTVIPALDVSGGRLVTWTRGGTRSSEAFGGDPRVAARAMGEAGATWIHVVDVDLARTGVLANADVVADVAESGAVRVQASGGVTYERDARRLLEAGAARVVVGSRALADDVSAEHLIVSLRDRIVIGIEVEEGVIRSRGADPVELDLMMTLGWLTGVGAPAFLVTAVGQVGGLGGPDVDTLRRVVRAGRPVLAAGGIASLDHLRALHDAGAVGAVVGRAALEGDLDLASALAWADTA